MCLADKIYSLLNAQCKDRICLSLEKSLFSNNNIIWNKSHFGFNRKQAGDYKQTSCQVELISKL